ncbi:MAG: hypothetical protein ACF8PN_02585 [Phycisphaerales bacterium]
MRLFIDTLVAAMLAALLAGVLTWQDQREQEKADVAAVRMNIRQIQQQIMLQSVLAKAPRNEYGFPRSIDPKWFGENTPTNPLVGPMHPWLEIAGEHEFELTHPSVKVASERSTASFWYNPRLGIVRARVPQMVSDRLTLETYNYVNESALTSLFGVELRDRSNAPNASKRADSIKLDRVLDESVACHTPIVVGQEVVAVVEQRFDRSTRIGREGVANVVFTGAATTKPAGGANGANRE